MKSVKAIEFVFDDCESIIVPMIYIIDIKIFDVAEYIRITDRQQFVTLIDKLTNDFRVKISAQFKDDRSIQLNYFEEINRFNRLKDMQDIVYVNILYNDYSIDSYLVPWYTPTPGHYKSSNNLWQTNIYDKNVKLTITIKRKSDASSTV